MHADEMIPHFPATKTTNLMERFPSFAALFVLLGVVALVAAACAGTNETPLDEEADLPPPEDIVSAVGTVRYVDLEGGFYGIVANDSTRYQPQDLGSNFREDGLRVRFRAVRQDSMMTTQMWGTPVEVLDILRLDD